MRFNFDIPEPNTKEALTPPSHSNSHSQSLSRSPSSATPANDEVEWLPLQNHPIFSTPTAANDAPRNRNLMAWDGASRLYYWDLNTQSLHRISLRFGEPDPTSVLAASPSKVLRTDVELNFVVGRITINRHGSALLLEGSNGLCVMYLYGRSSSKDSAVICRTVFVGSDLYLNTNNAIRTLKVSWHPYSDTHLGILSSDSVFRLYDLSSAIEQPEQEYYLQPVVRGRSRNASSICPVDFSFGGDHLWDRFSVFVLFSDGAIYILCPVVPFGSVYKWESVLEIYSDAQTFGLKSGSAKAVGNATLAVSWLEATFPELARQAAEGGTQPALKSHPYAPFDASVSLQGPLHKVYHGNEEDSEFKVTECDGRAVSFLYKAVSKDSVLVTVWSGGQLQIDALADEIQPVWMVGNHPRISVDLQKRVVGFAMICETHSNEESVVSFEQSSDKNIWLGHSPPLLKLGTVDLALPGKTDTGSVISLFNDPLIPERIYCVHDGGVDSIVLHFLPFTNQKNGIDDDMRPPTVQSVLNTCQVESSVSSLYGFVALADSFGSCWIVGLTSGFECIVLGMESWNLLLPARADKEKKFESLEENTVTGDATIISKELLAGPKVVIVPPTSPNPVAADSIEGRSTLHQYFKLFHENYVEYAHKVYFELKHHGPQLKKIIDEQHARLREAQQKLAKVEEKQENLENRIDRVIQTHGLLEERLLNLRNLPGIHKKPLSKAEREFKMELDKFRGVEIDALHTTIEAINGRIKRYSSSPQSKRPNQRRLIAGRRMSNAEDEMAHLKSSIAKLSLVNSENTKKVKLVDSALRNRESSS
ncbi:putative nucleoporin NUP88/NUP82 [Helianthus annuus]|uniref:Putative nuclear pore complex protein n=1 Tax=Helianthus annuus TaxID=4232 RepID=A0A251SMI8_HELAN|nr:nuclear pore complex protein NUP88 [Helianthus annuus]KAJ0465946.1 putative nucleoporin NUP88/NUP82 [Helianthus annuus]KAJ0470900.1 putative nucleoporin NUP88/NUP82 [Helianthus annuus]KAJ0487523.1 putative nucleoporin NUP88/NUP82 [Helianthus annuus]KAJ0661651.1 putative nucleoporin NUP88/NUP82 [Helianthus annuus]KAJ0855882.1 putative nucleoporin NUP88/NUP82 [Helianthus annuus]